MGSAGKDKAPLPVRLRKEGSRNQTTEIGTVIVDGIGAINCRVWMHKVRVWRAHREVTGTIPLNRRGIFPVRFDLIVTSVKEFTVEVNKLEIMNPIQADGIEG